MRRKRVKAKGRIFIAVLPMIAGLLLINKVHICASAYLVPSNKRANSCLKKQESNAKPIKKNTAETKRSMAVKSGKKNIKAKQQEKPKSKQTKHVVKSVPTEVKAISDRKAQSIEKAKKQKELDEATYTANAMKYIEALVEDTRISDYLNKNVSRHASEVIDLLTTPRTDEAL